MYRRYNANPSGKRVGDCTVRAIALALNRPWEEVYTDLAVEGLRRHDMPSANHVWGTYLRENCFRREALPNTCPDCYTIHDFCRDHPKGIYVLALQSHVVCVRNGDHYDTWDSGDETPLYYWHREEQ